MLQLKTLKMDLFSIQLLQQYYHQFEKRARLLALIFTECMFSCNFTWIRYLFIMSPWAKSCLSSHFSFIESSLSPHTRYIWIHS